MRKHKKGKVTRRKLEKKRAKEKGRIVTDFNHRMVRNMATFLSNNNMANTQKKRMKKKQWNMVNNRNYEHLFF